MQMIDDPRAAWGCILAAAAIYTAWLGCAMKREAGKRKWLPLLMLIPAGTGLICAKAGYEILQYGELASVFRWCMTTGMAGTAAGTLLAGRIAGCGDRNRLADRMAPALCLAMALVRLSQRWLGEVGAGPWMEEGTMFCRPPFVLINEWDEKLAAVFIPEALAALAGAAITLIRGRKRGERAPGGTAVIAILWMTIPQMMAEQFRTGHYMHWRMVRAEQILCAGTALAAVILYRIGRKKKAGTGTGDLLPGTAAYLAMCGVITVAQFALDGKVAMAEAVCWALYAAAAAGMMGVCGWMTLKGEKAEPGGSSGRRRR